MSESMESQENTTEMDSAVVPSCSISYEVAVPRLPSDSFQFPDLNEFQIRLPALSPFSSRAWNWEPPEFYDFRRKMRRRPRPFKPVLTRIFERDYDQPVNDVQEISDKEIKYYSMFNRHKEDEVIYKNTGTYITHSNKNRYLCEAVNGNDLPFVKRLLNLGISPNCFDSHKRTPLHIAVSKGHCEMVRLLLDMGADPNLKDGLGNSCLHLAACTNNVEIALILIRGGASVHAVDIRGRSPIQLAQSKLRILQQCPDGFLKGKVKQVIDMLLMYLAKNNEREDSNGNTALLTTCQNRLQITDSPEQISNELDNLSKILNQMGSLTIT